jgi:hypothetical protein
MEAPMISTSLPGRMRVSLRPNVVFTHLDVPATSQSSRYTGSAAPPGQ